MNAEAARVEEIEEELLDDSEFEIEIEDDTPEADRNRPVRAEGSQPEIPDDDEIGQYSENVQSRIKKLRYEYHEERRAKEEAARVREEAIRYAETVHKENERLRKSLAEGEQVLVQQAKGRLQAQIDQAKKLAKEAYDTGDSDAFLEAQEKLTNLQNEKFRVDNYKPAPQPQAQQYQPQQPAPQVKRPDPEAEAWASRNDWFGKNEEMTGYAFGVHERIVKSGVSPNSQAYYSAIDEAMRKRFPEEFDDGSVEVNTQPRQTGNVVAPASRSSKKPRKVTLTPSAVKLAKRLGLTNEQYAAQMMKDSRNG
jgi:hypothetical protein